MGFLFLQHLVHLVGYELHLGTHNDLYRGLGRTHDARHPRGFDLLFIHQRVVLDFNAQAGEDVYKRQTTT